VCLFCFLQFRITQCNGLVLVVKVKLRAACNERILIKQLKWCKNNFLHPLKFKFVDDGAIFMLDCLQIERLAAGNIPPTVTGVA